MPKQSRRRSARRRSPRGTRRGRKRSSPRRFRSIERFTSGRSRERVRTFRAPSTPPSTPPRAPKRTDSDDWKKVAAEEVLEHLQRVPTEYVIRPSSPSVVLIFENAVYKVFQKDSEAFQNERQAYETVKIFAPGILPPNVDTTMEIAGYSVIQLPPLTSIPMPTQRAEENLKDSLTKVLQPIWDNKHKHGDVIQQRTNLIHLGNFMYHGEGKDRKIVLIDFELFADDPNNTEAADWQTAIFKDPVDVDAQRAALMTFRDGFASASDQRDP